MGASCGKFGHGYIHAEATLSDEGTVRVSNTSMRKPTTSSIVGAGQYLTNEKDEHTTLLPPSPGWIWWAALQTKAINPWLVKAMNSTSMTSPLVWLGDMGRKNAEKNADAVVSHVTQSKSTTGTASRISRVKPTSCNTEPAAFKSPVNEPLDVTAVAAMWTSGIDELELNELFRRKDLLKRKLKNFDRRFAQQRGRPTVQADREPLRPMYKAYQALRERIYVLVASDPARCGQVAVKAKKGSLVT
ncbi:hypothetical protein MPSEU_000985600 [Mayamaea pseudoterrestris]|nr:hypothetical protein MPSEU_000985600 [Mayamaea pseudoterrestris]